MQLKDKWRNLVKFKHISRVPTDFSQLQNLNLRSASSLIYSSLTLVLSAGLTQSNFLLLVPGIWSIQSRLFF